VGVPACLPERDTRGWECLRACRCTHAHTASQVSAPRPLSACANNMPCEHTDIQYTNTQYTNTPMCAPRNARRICVIKGLSLSLSCVRARVLSHSPSLTHHAHSLTLARTQTHTHARMHTHARTHTRACIHTHSVATTKRQPIRKLTLPHPLCPRLSLHTNAHTCTHTHSVATTKRQPIRKLTLPLSLPHPTPSPPPSLSEALSPCSPSTLSTNKRTPIAFSLSTLSFSLHIQHTLSPLSFSLSNFPSHFSSLHIQALSTLSLSPFPSQTHHGGVRRYGQHRCVYVRACVRACVRASERASERVCACPSPQYHPPHSLLLILFVPPVPIFEHFTTRCRAFTLR
jgi:hypothetical protein